jgi:hypothetical protein
MLKFISTSATSSHEEMLKLSATDAAEKEMRAKLSSSSMDL